MIPSPRPRYRSLRDGVRADVGRAIAMATGGAIAFAPVEYVLTSWAYAGSPSLASRVRLIALVATLALVLWLLLALALALATIGWRLVHTRLAPARGRGPGLFASAPLVDGIRPGVPRLWATVVTGLAVGLTVQRAGVAALARYKEPQLTAGLIAVVAVAAAVGGGPLIRALAASIRVGALALAGLAPPRLVALNPLGRWRAAGVAVAALVGAALAVAWYALPPARTVLPVRLVLAAVVVALGAGVGAQRAARGARRARRSRCAGLAVAAAGAGLVTSTLAWWGADLETKYIAITASPALDRLIGLVRVANDLDRDGYGSVLGEADCAPLAHDIYPGAIDVPGDGIDQNCDGRDFSLAELVAPPGASLGVPEPFKRDWNILLLTIDTVRYDHTSFGGYRDGPKHRDTTPRLAELVRRSTSFAYAHAPSAGTMASIPAILTSKFFHSGIALDEKRPPGTPPKIMPENTLLPEIVKRAGYRTGVIGSHDWWNDWGLDQGVDDYDNSIGAKPDPRRVAADRVTDHALAWISRHQGQRWFLWAHYIDPHGYYVAHPDVVDWGSSDPDLYDAEIKWTDREVGRLLDELQRLPSHDRTIVIITSDHGESMGEHTVPLGTHGTALFHELLHVPLIVYVPDNKPRQLHGAVSPLDIVPTVAELVGADVHDLSFEGRSLVPQLFYGKDDLDRVVFAETNAPGKQRAAISASWKLIYYLSSNLYELFDVHADPEERTNLAPQNPPAMARMKRELEAWMERVLYARDPVFNQAYRQISDVILRAPPNPEVPSTGQTIAGTVDVIGIGPAIGKPIVPGARTDIHVYLHVRTASSTSYRFQLAVWQTGTAVPGPITGPASPAAPSVPPPGTPIVHSALRGTADGAYASERWHAGDYIRERFTVTLPADWRGERISVGLVVTDPAGTRIPATGAALPTDPSTFVLSELPLGSLPARHP